MGGVIVILCVLFIFVRGDLALLLVARFAPKKLMDHVSQGQRAIAEKLFWFARVLGGMRVDFERHTDGHLPPVFLIVSNHQSLADIPALAVVFPRHSLRFVAKKSLGIGIPYVSQNLRAGGSALISRTGDFRQGQRELRRFAGLARQGICPVIFPEGTRSRTGRVRDFFSGAVRIVLEQQPMPVLSVAVDGGYRISTVPKILLHLRGVRYRVKPLTLYPAPQGKKEIAELLATMKKEITRQVTSWHQE